MKATTRLRCFAVLIGVRLLFPVIAGAAPEPSRWASFVEPDFPFFSSVLDARHLNLASNNLTPRGLILNLGHESWVAFDLDLLRVSAVWRGTGVTAVSMSQGSYHVPGHKVSDGQGTLPRPAGEVWMANGIYPGWQVGDAFTLEDPRPPGSDPREIGRGPLPPDRGRFQAIRFLPRSVRLEYLIGGAGVQDVWSAGAEDGRIQLERVVRCEPSSQTRWLLAGVMHPQSGCSMKLESSSPKSGVQLSAGSGHLLSVRVPPSTQPIEFKLILSHPSAAGARQIRSLSPSIPPNPRRDGRTTQGRPNRQTNTAVVIDNIDLPLDNEWRRNVRLADIAFFRNGRAAAVTFDGDVWLIERLKGNLTDVRWRRFASGLHEPLSVIIQDEQIIVFDRNGLWRLRDTDGNGTADLHELVSNAFTQTAETREFATGLRASPDGSFIISKGGQQTATIGRHNGTVLRVPADGRPAEVLAYGLRMPFIGVHPRTGWITASDQQGHYVPATPLHWIHDGQFYGFISVMLPKESYPAPIADALTWIPHPVNASGASQVWLTGAQMGPLNDALIHLGYYRPELFVVRLNQRSTRAEAAVISLTRDLPFPPLNGAVNPVDGQLYVTGFQIWGTEAPQISGLARVRYTGGTFAVPRDVVAMREGILLRFEAPLDASAATNTANYSAERWNYKRSPAYGSPHYKLDGSKGQESMPPSSAYLSKDGRAVFVGIPDMRSVMQMRLGWTLRARDGTAASHNAYFTPVALPAFDAAGEGFGTLHVDLTPRKESAMPDTPITAAEGKRVAELMGCLACHSTDGSTLGKVGPSWKGIFGRERKLADGSKVRADDAYLRESIREPGARILAGFDKTDTGMPSYEGVISEAQIDALVEYLKTVR